MNYEEIAKHKEYIAEILAPCTTAQKAAAANLKLKKLKIEQTRAERTPSYVTRFNLVLYFDLTKPRAKRVMEYISQNAVAKKDA